MECLREYYAAFETGAGWIGLKGSEKGLSKATLPQPSAEHAVIMLGKEVLNLVFSAEFFQPVIEQYIAYFKGQRVTFTERLDLSGHTPFQRAVWKATQEIPWGKTRSYAEVARNIGKPSAPRAVGQALGRNPLLIIIPCHRVLASDGTLGGFGGGLELKRYLLGLETGHGGFKIKEI
jgi:methylated-DNA-[protein]-cysteine S-methyltransferase